MKRLVFATLFSLVALVALVALAQQPTTVVATQTEEVRALQVEVKELRKELDFAKTTYIAAISHNEDHFATYQSNVAWGVGIVGVFSL